MLKKLQRKFVFLTTSISVVVLLLIAVAINVANYVSVMNASDEILKLLVAGDLKMGQPFANHGKFPNELPFTTRFFVVSSDDNDIIEKIDTRHISYVTSEDAKRYANMLMENGGKTGMADNFRFAISETDTGVEYFFLDIQQELIGFENNMISSAVVVFVAGLSIFFLSVLLSKKAVAPIAYSYERQKSFITNVSHEFKTPLAIIKADCDVIEIDNGEGEWTDSIKTQILRLDNLVESLISLTKLEEKQHLIKTNFSLSDAVNDTVGEFTSSIKSADLSLTLDIAKNLSYNGDEQHIRKLISTLTENAVKYSPSQTVLSVTLKASGSRNVLTIENACDDVGVGKHNDWFLRFHRGDQSRNSSTKGYGIGLSIAKTICDLHGAKISAESKTGKEIIITVIF